MELPDEMWQVDLGQSIIHITPEEAQAIKRQMLDPVSDVIRVIDIQGFESFVRLDKIVHLSYSGRAAREAAYERRHAFDEAERMYCEENFPSFD